MSKINRRRLVSRALSGVAGVAVGNIAKEPRAFIQDTSADSGYDLSAGTAGCSEVALMFNVGAGYEPAVGILDTLGAYGIAGSMFVMGWLAEQNPGLVQQMSARGHSMGSHGYLPPELTSRSDDDITADLLAAASALNWALGYEPGPWFTPYASASDGRVRSIANSLGLIAVGWSVESGDWTPDATPDSIYGNVMNGMFDGAIVELHMDAQQSINGTAVALPWILDDLTSQGYRVVTVPEIAGGC
jgi:peptidoglycan/xylan/chitin deacetylase (PgdA/CDA1 family)